MGHIAEALKRARQEREDQLRLGEAPRAASLAEQRMDRPADSFTPQLIELPGESRSPGAVESDRTDKGPRRLADLLRPGLTRLRDQGSDETTAAIAPPVQWDVEAPLVTLRERSSSIAEQYRAIRTWLLCRVKPRDRTCLCITSSIPGEGKTVTVANLAVAMSEIRRMRVLALDCDLRQGALAGLFKLSRSPGFTDVLSGEATLDEAIVQTPIPNLCILPAGRLKDANPAELLNSAAAARIFDEVRDRFHYTLVDTPPVQSVSDVGVIGALCTGLVMVVRMHKTASHMVRQSITWLQSNNLNVMGCVATGCSLKDATYSYRSGEYPET